MKLEDAIKTVKNQDQASTEEMVKDDVVGIILKALYMNGHNDLAEWNAFHSNTILCQIIDELYKKVESEWENIDYVAALGASGTPLAIGLSLLHDKKFIFINDRWGITKKFQPIKPSNGIIIKDKNILVIDSVLRTGLTALNGIEYIKDCGGIPKLMVIALLEDWIDESIYNDLKDIDFYYLLNWNEKVEKISLELEIIKSI